MTPIYLYIRDFFAHEESEIDFTAFSSALILGKTNENDLISNGVGKTSIFRAIEFALFNQVRDPLLQKDIVLEKLIRDETNKVSVILDFALGEEIFRIVRSRTRKGISDLSFFKRNVVPGSAHTSETNKELWGDISSRRTQDTEADLFKKIKIGYKAFIGTCHFMQGDLSGLATATPEKRKAILRETLELSAYAKLEDIAKERASNLSKEIEKNKAVLLSIGEPEKEIEELRTKLISLQEKEVILSTNLLQKRKERDSFNEEHALLLSRLSVLEAQSAAVLSKRSSLINDISKLEGSISEYSGKRKSIISLSRKLMEEIGVLRARQIDLGEPKSKELLLAQQEWNRLNQEANEKLIKLGTIDAEIKECLIPLPADGTCKHCRQILTEEHRRACMEKERVKKEELQKERVEYFASYNEIIELRSVQEKNVLSFNQQAREMEETKRNILSQEKEIFENKAMCTEYSSLIKKFQLDFAQKRLDLAAAEIEVLSSSVKEMEELSRQIAAEKRRLVQISAEVSSANQILAEAGSKKAVLSYSIEQKNKDIQKKEELSQSISAGENEFIVYPSIVQAFGAGGIPNLIIQNVLEDLQAEANELLAQMRPGLQLAFSTEKVRSDGVVADTLGIDYFLNNKPRDYSVLSGAQRLCVAFSLKLGLSFLLSKMFGSQIGLLLFDEVDQALDKASIDAFAEIIRLFQKDFKILVITHNDRLREKLTSAATILVEQDQNMVSRARVSN